MQCLPFDQLQDFVGLLPAILEFATSGTVRFTTPDGSTFEWVLRTDGLWCFNGKEDT